MTSERGDGSVGRVVVSCIHQEGGSLPPQKKQKKGTLRQEDRGRPAGGALSV